MSQAIEISAIVPVMVERYDEVATLATDYRRALEQSGRSFEIIYVLDGDIPVAREALQQLRREGTPLTIVQLAKAYGETTALTAGFEHAKGAVILSLPAYRQIECGELGRLIGELDGVDMVVARRWPRLDSRYNRAQARFFNRLLETVSDLRLHDLGCNVRLFRRQVVDEVTLYGNQHRFLPMLAHQRGFKVKEVDAAQASADTQRRVYSPGTYLGHLLDILTILFLVKFTKRPLRFFGMLGMGVFSAGFLITLYLVGERLFGDVALANRPALLLSSLLIILGIQVMAIGLIGEIIIFTHAKELKEYTIAEVIH